MASVLSIDAPRAERNFHSATGSVLLKQLLDQQQQLTAVEKFSQRHEAETEPLQARHYRDLIPLSKPVSGEQYAFEVDLDACSGCKACVVACHNLNGLEEDELWRSVGLLQGGSSSLPVLQHVTTACHHCLEPPCLEGCPVLAYEKDPITGIVRHLDDQCIGCQYCILKCPYDVPKYSRAKGIVRKCDMCADRLAADEAPACVQACPSRAIRITVVETRQVAENAEANLFLPGAPEPRWTLPTTHYKTRKALPANLLPADFFVAARQHAHWPLVLMLVLTQMSVGAFLIDQVLRDLDLATGSAPAPQARAVHLATAFALGMLGLVSSIFHLGRPWLAYRAILGWRRSWLSREVLAFGAFALAASVYAATPWLESAGATVAAEWEHVLGGVVALTGLAGVACSTMIYASTRRALWNPVYTGCKFLLTAALLGTPVALLVRLAASAGTTHARDASVALAHLRLAFWILLACAAIKLTMEAAIFCWLRARTLTPLRRTAILMTGDLARATAIRFACGAVGGLALPAALLMFVAHRSDTSSFAVALAMALLLALNFAGEMLERYLFFAAVVAPKMPGAPSV